MAANADIVGSFKRTNNSPLEDSYIFNTLNDLNTWKSANTALLHDGLLKVVKGTINTEQSMYSYDSVSDSFKKIEGLTYWKEY